MKNEENIAWQPETAPEIHVMLASQPNAFNGFISIKPDIIFDDSYSGTI